jgi:hypothetical protein
MLRASQLAATEPDSGPAEPVAAVRLHCKRRRDRRDSAETRVAEAASAPCSSSPLSSAANKVQPLTVVHIRFAFSGRPPQTSTHRAPSDPAFARSPIDSSSSTPPRPSPVARRRALQPSLPSTYRVRAHFPAPSLAAALLAASLAVGSAVRPCATALPCIPARPPADRVPQAVVPFPF